MDCYVWSTPYNMQLHNMCTHGLSHAVLAMQPYYTRRKARLGDMVGQQQEQNYGVNQYFSSRVYRGV